LRVAFVGNGKLIVFNNMAKQAVVKIVAAERGVAACGFDFKQALA